MIVMIRVHAAGVIVHFRSKTGRALPFLEPALALLFTSRRRQRDARPKDPFRVSTARRYLIPGMLARASSPLILRRLGDGVGLEVCIACMSSDRALAFLMPCA